MADASAPDIELTEDDKDLLTALHPSSLAAAARECVAAASSSAAAAAAPAAAAPARPAAAAAASSAKALLAASAAPVSRRDEKIAALRVASGVASREEVESADLKHKFWSTQPVPRLAEQVKDHGAIEPLRTLADVRVLTGRLPFSCWAAPSSMHCPYLPPQVNPEAYALPPGFEWCCIDVTSEIEMNETYEVCLGGEGWRCSKQSYRALVASSCECSLSRFPFPLRSSLPTTTLRMTMLCFGSLTRCPFCAGEVAVGGVLSVCLLRSSCPQVGCVLLCCNSAAMTEVRTLTHLTLTSRALTPPHFFPEWHVGVRLSGKSRRLVACITGVPAVVEVYGHMRHVCEINYLCVCCA